MSELLSSLTPQDFLCILLLVLVVALVIAYVVAMDREAKLIYQVGRYEDEATPTLILKVREEVEKGYHFGRAN